MAITDNPLDQQTPQDATKQPVAQKPLTPVVPSMTPMPGATPTAGATTGLAGQAPMTDPLAFQQPVGGAVANAGTLPQTPVAPAPATPNVGDYVKGENFMQRQYLGQDQTLGTPVYGDWQDAQQVGQFDAQGNPLYRTTGLFNQAGVQGRQQIAAATPEQRQAQFDALKQKYAGQLEQGNSGERLAFNAPIEDQNNYDYLQQLINAQKYSPDNLKFLTSQNQIQGTPGQESDDPAFFAKYGINDPNHVSPFEQSQAGLTAQANANSGYSTIQGGKTYTDPAEALKAFQADQSQGPGASAMASRSPLSPGGAASDVGGGNPANPLTAAQGGAPGATAGGRASYTTSPLTAENSLIGQQINAGPGVDRYKQAQDALENYRKGTEAGYKADINDISGQSFGAGRGVSGQNRTRLGNLTNARENDLNTKGFDFLNNALTGSIEDAYRNTGIAQQQQGFQKGLSDTAFNQELQRAQLEDALTNSSFGRALSQQTAGYANSPEQWDAYLSGQFGNQASAAGNAAAQSFRGAPGQQGGLTADDIMRILSQYQGPQGGSPQPNNPGEE